MRTEYQQNIHELIAPSHFPGEIASALTKAERQKLIRVGNARRLVQDILNTPPVFYAIDSLFYRAAKSPHRPGRGIYDCLYVALAEQENCELVTADDKLMNALQRQFSLMLSLASLP